MDPVPAPPHPYHLPVGVACLLVGSILVSFAIATASWPAVIVGGVTFGLGVTSLLAWWDEAH